MASEYVREQQTTGALSGAVTGVALGAKIGSMIPVPGGAIFGAVAGTAIGAITGAGSAKDEAQRAERMRKRHEEEQRQAQAAAEKAQKNQAAIATETSAREAKDGMLAQVPATADDSFLATQTSVSGPGTPYDRSIAELYGRSTVG